MTDDVSIPSDRAAFDDTTGFTGPLPNRVARFVQRNQLATFFFVAYSWAWTYWVLFWLAFRPDIPPVGTGFIGAWGPLVAAVFVIWASGGDIRRWFHQATRWRVKPRWYVLALTIPLAATETGTVVYALAGVELSFLPYETWTYLARFVYVLLLAGALEEFGWRGFAQPRLQERYSALAGAVCIGFAWACWHIPVMFLLRASGYSAFPQYLATLVAMSVILAWLYNATGGVVLLPMVMHAANNLASFFEPVGAVPDIAALLASRGGLALYGIVAIALLARYGRAGLAPSRPSPPIPHPLRSVGTGGDSDS